MELEPEQADNLEQCTQQRVGYLFQSFDEMQRVRC